MTEWAGAERPKKNLEEKKGKSGSRGQRARSNVSDLVETR